MCSSERGLKGFCFRVDCEYARFRAMAGEVVDFKKKCTCLGGRKTKTGLVRRPWLSGGHPLVAVGD